jgi:hypothetical protein
MACSAAFWVFGLIATQFGCVYTDIQTGIILTFIGILATFVVVSNYAQVQDVEEKHNKEKEQLRKENAELRNEIDKKIEEQNKKNTAQTLFTIGMLLLNEGKVENAIGCCVASVLCYCEIHKIEECFLDKEVFSTFTKKEDIKVRKYLKNKWIDELTKYIVNTKIREIIEEIKKINEL